VLSGFYSVTEPLNLNLIAPIDGELVAPRETSILRGVFWAQRAVQVEIERK
jgi:hypothetical protein